MTEALIIVGIVASFVASLVVAFKKGQSYERTVQETKRIKETNVALTTKSRIERDVDSGELPIKYRD